MNFPESQWGYFRAAQRSPPMGPPGGAAGFLNNKQSIKKHQAAGQKNGRRQAKDRMGEVSCPYELSPEAESCQKEPSPLTWRKLFGLHRWACHGVPAVQAGGVSHDMTGGGADGRGPRVPTAHWVPVDRRKMKASTVGGGVGEADGRGPRYAARGGRGRRERCRG